MGRNREAAACIGQAIALCFDDCRVSQQSRHGLSRFRHPVGAEAAFRRAWELRPADADMVNNLGNALHDQKKTDAAWAAHQRALAAQRPHFAPAHNNVGILLVEQGKREEAAASYRRADPASAGFCRGPQ